MRQQRKRRFPTIVNPRQKNTQFPSSLNKVCFVDNAWLNDARKTVWNSTLPHNKAPTFGTLMSYALDLKYSPVSRPSNKHLGHKQLRSETKLFNSKLFKDPLASGFVGSKVGRYEINAILPHLKRSGFLYQGCAYANMRALVTSAKVVITDGALTNGRTQTKQEIGAFTMRTFYNSVKPGSRRDRWCCRPHGGERGCRKSRRETYTQWSKRSFKCCAFYKDWRACRPHGSPKLNMKSCCANIGGKAIFPQKRVRGKTQFLICLVRKKALDSHPYWQSAEGNATKKAFANSMAILRLSL